MPSRVRTYARRYLIYTHRYLGIALSLMFVVWFASGIAMMYVGGMPRLTGALRVERLPPLALDKVTLTPAQAAQKLEAGPGVQGTLTTVLERPAYQFQGRASGTVFADSGEVLGDIDVPAALAVASRFVGVAPEQVHFERTLDTPDQWTLGLKRQMPLHKFVVADADATQVYVSPATAGVVQLTTGRKRTLAWLGTIPHWLYFAALKNNQPAWYRTVVWLSTACCVLAALGLVLAFTQFRRTRPFRFSLAIPYKQWLRWHYIGGALFGVFALTWAFSGLLSMEPYAWTNARGLEIDRQVFTGGRVELEHFGVPDVAGLQRAAGNSVIKELGFTRIQGDYYYNLRAVAPVAPGEQKLERLHQPYLVTGREEPDNHLISADTLQPRSAPFTAQSIITRLTDATPGRHIVEQTLLTDYDSYYYSRARQRALPVLRVKFDDPAASWVYVDPATCSIVAQTHRFSRLERWLYNGLHSLDFNFWYSKRPFWDIGMIVLLLGGLATSGLGAYLGIKRLIKDLTPAPERVAERLLQQ